MSYDSVFDEHKHRKLNQEFELGDILGKGGFGRVIKATRKCDRFECAIKVIKCDSSSNDVRKIKKEAQILSNLDHTNIVRYLSSWVETVQISKEEYEKVKNENIKMEIDALSIHGCIKEDEDDSEGTITYINSDETIKNEKMDVDSPVDKKENIMELSYLYIQMEFCKNRTLRSVINDKLCLHEIKLKLYFKQLCEGLSYIHGQNIIHRDLKPENVFLTAKDVLKIGDFGLSKQIPLNELITDEELPDTSLTGPCGTKVYRAPELFTRSTVNIKVDIYSLGIIFFEMCSNGLELRKFLHGGQKFENVYFPGDENMKKDLIKEMLNENDQERPTTDQILEIINSEKSIQEIRSLIEKKKSIQKSKTKILVQDSTPRNFQKMNLQKHVITTLTKICELHGARTVSVPIFLPHFDSVSDSLTSFLNQNGNVVAISKTTRLPFCWYFLLNHLVHDRLQNLRFCTIGSVFKEDEILPVEKIESAFQAISLQKNDIVNDAEVLFIAREICQSCLGNNQVLYVVNQSVIFKKILDFFELSSGNATLLTNMLLNLWDKLATQTFLAKTLSQFSDSKNIINWILSLRDTFENFERKIKQLADSDDEIKTAVRNLKLTVCAAKQFGIDSQNIIVDPLLVDGKYSSGFLFSIMHKSSRMKLADGGRFESLIQKCLQEFGSDKLGDFSATEVSFNIENFTEFMTAGNFSTADILIKTKFKLVAIPLLKELLSKNLRCEILHDIIDADLNEKNPVAAIEICEEDHSKAIVRKFKKVVVGSKVCWSQVEVFQSLWQDEDFSTIMQLYVNRCRTK